MSEVGEWRQEDQEFKVIFGYLKPCLKQSHSSKSFYLARCCNTRVGSKAGGVSDSYQTRDWGTSGCFVPVVAELLCK